MIWVLSMLAFNPTFFRASSAFRFNLVSASYSRSFSLHLILFLVNIVIFLMLITVRRIWYWYIWSHFFIIQCLTYILIAEVSLTFSRFAIQYWYFTPANFVWTSYVENARRSFSGRNVVYLMTCPPTLKGSCSFVDFVRKTCQQEYKPYVLLLDNSWGLAIVSL